MAASTGFPTLRARLCTSRARIKASPCKLSCLARRAKRLAGKAFFRVGEAPRLAREARSLAGTVRRGADQAKIFAAALIGLTNADQRLALRAQGLAHRAQGLAHRAKGLAHRARGLAHRARSLAYAVAAAHRRPSRAACQALLDSCSLRKAPRQPLDKVANTLANADAVDRRLLAPQLRYHPYLRCWQPALHCCRSCRRQLAR
jgi:hypothetical protein